MVKEKMRKCPGGGDDGHDSRKCNEKACLKLFGVNILEKKEQPPLRKIASTGDLESLTRQEKIDDDDDHGYASDGYMCKNRGKAVHPRKKGKPWTEKEHRNFLAGLENLGKGDWRGISKKFVITRTPTQVASHAQKYFQRRQASSEKKRRSSVFDMTLTDKVSDPEDTPTPPQPTATAMPLQNIREAPSQMANGFLHHYQETQQICPSFGVPNYPGNPFMCGLPGNVQSYVQVPLPSLMNYVKPVYPFMPPYAPPSFANCVPIVAHPSGIPWPRSLQHNFPQEGGAASTSGTKTQDLPETELKIGQPQKSNLSSKASGPISVS